MNHPVVAHFGSIWPPGSSETQPSFTSNGSNSLHGLVKKGWRERGGVGGSSRCFLGAPLQVEVSLVSAEDMWDVDSRSIVRRSGCYWVRRVPLAMKLLNRPAKAPRARNLEFWTEVKATQRRFNFCSAMSKSMLLRPFSLCEVAVNLAATPCCRNKAWANYILVEIAMKNWGSLWRKVVEAPLHNQFRKARKRTVGGK